MNTLKHLEEEHELNDLALMNLKYACDEIDLIVLHNFLHSQELMNHGINCSCTECTETKKLLRDGVKSGMIYLSGLETDKDKIMKEEKHE